ncbi:hypothetical protein DIC82_08575 [Clostridium beijerinckii]|nr:hypothetical protein DIC82_08575 [Clostridium beijerinckii]
MWRCDEIILEWRVLAALRIKHESFKLLGGSYDSKALSDEGKETSNRSFFFILLGNYNQVKYVDIVTPEVISSTKIQMGSKPHLKSSFT